MNTPIEQVKEDTTDSGGDWESWLVNELRQAVATLFDNK